jgi:hypothetical protein
MGQIVCMSVVDMKPQPLYDNPFDLIDGVCFTYSIHDRESFDSLRATVVHKKESLRDKCIVVISLTLCGTPRMVTQEEGKNLASEINSEFYEVDLRSYAGLDESFIYLLENINRTKSLRLYSCVEETEILRHKVKRSRGLPRCSIS